MEVLNDILGYPNRKIFQDTSCFSFSLDSVLLANFATIRLRDKNILDLGTGNGVIPLILSLRCDKKIVGVEIQRKLVDMAKKSVEYNHLGNQIEIIHSDMKLYLSNETREKYDLITCNPPYFKVQQGNYFNDSEEKKIARHEVCIDLESLLATVKGLLKNNGYFAIVHRPERLLEIFDLFRNYSIEPKRVRFVYEHSNKESTLVLIEGVKYGKPGLQIEPPFLLKDKTGKKTEIYEKMLTEVGL